MAIIVEDTGHYIQIKNNNDSITIRDYFSKDARLKEKELLPFKQALGTLVEDILQQHSQHILEMIEQRGYTNDDIASDEAQEAYLAKHVDIKQLRDAFLAIDDNIAILRYFWNNPQSATPELPFLYKAISEFCEEYGISSFEQFSIAIHDSNPFVSELGVGIPETMEAFSSTEQAYMFVKEYNMVGEDTIDDL